LNPQQENDFRGNGGTTVGIDAGATLAKLAVRTDAGDVRYETLLSGHVADVMDEIARLQPDRVGLTGCGAKAIEARCAERGATGTGHFQEFAAWGAGAHAQLCDADGEGFAESAPYLLISLGTGTSVMRVADGEVLRVGGTALGGGTVLGLGVALTGCESFAELCELAGRGDPSRVDLLVADIYQEGEIALPGETTASAFGKLSRWLAEGRGEAGAPSREDLAVGVMSLVAENVALVCAGVSAMTQTPRWVFGGSTLNDNPALQKILVRVGTSFGMETRLLPDGGHAGARGALELVGR